MSTTFSGELPPKTITQSHTTNRQQSEARRSHLATTRPPGILSLASLVRGIRFHDGFVTELHGDPELPGVSRALNARAIVRNRVPYMNEDAHFPYCFRHPALPAGATPRALLARYPGSLLLRYQAWDNAQSGQDIYRQIMAAPVRYACTGLHPETVCPSRWVSVGEEAG
ncbi:hypothetical protein KJ359_011196 [Pestalotiopsis sp. 9143b]|nr:hypothetical protein KJ359_011196 [Pestalotiopsis sp. 9143b]